MNHPPLYRPEAPRPRLGFERVRKTAVCLGGARAFHEQFGTVAERSQVVLGFKRLWAGRFNDDAPRSMALNIRASWQDDSFANQE